MSDNSTILVSIRDQFKSVALQTYTLNQANFKTMTIVDFRPKIIHVVVGSGATVARQDINKLLVQTGRHCGTDNV